MREPERTRIRIGVGAALLAVVTMALGWAGVAAGAGRRLQLRDDAVPVGAQLAVAETTDGRWTTAHVFSAEAGALGPVDVTRVDPSYGPSGYSGTVAPGGSLLVERVGGLFRRSEFFMLDAVAGVDEFAHLAFDDGVTRASFDVPPMPPVPVGATAVVGGVRNDWNPADGLSSTKFVTNVNVWSSDGAASLEIVALGADGLPVGAVQTARLSVGVNQIRVAALFRVGSLRVTVVSPLCSPCPAAAPVYGFVSSSVPAGGNAHVWVLEP